MGTPPYKPNAIVLLHFDGVIADNDVGTWGERNRGARGNAGLRAWTHFDFVEVDALVLLLEVAHAYLHRVNLCAASYSSHSVQPCTHQSERFRLNSSD